jgi:hypothetical protein
MRTGAQRTKRGCHISNAHMWSRQALIRGRVPAHQESIRFRLGARYQEATKKEGRPISMSISRLRPLRYRRMLRALPAAPATIIGGTGLPAPPGNAPAEMGFHQCKARLE